MVTQETRFPLCLMPLLDSNPALPLFFNQGMSCLSLTNISNNAMYRVFSVTSGGHFDCNSFYNARLKSGTAASSIEMIH